MTQLDSEYDIFFDAYDEIRYSTDSSSSANTLVNEELLRCLDYEIWTREPTSVQDRRQRFLRGMRLDDPILSSVGCSTSTEESAAISSEEHLDLERIMNGSGAVSNSWSYPDGREPEDSFCCVRDLDSGMKFMVHDIGEDGLPSLVREVGSNKYLTLQDFEIVLGLPRSVQKFLQREIAPYAEKTVCNIETKLNKYVNWWRSFTSRKMSVGSCKDDTSVKKALITRSMRTRVRHYRKSCMEFTALYKGQEIQAHKGRIMTMKFCRNGRYLASGGEDCVVRIWQIIEVENSYRCDISEVSPRLNSEVKSIKLVHGKGSNVAPVLVPKHIFKIEETPLQELKGHTSDILDLSWSKSNCLLTSSKDKTVRLWKVGCPGCLQIFQHNDYVTCIQFNPIDENFFISGSIDGKVRIWEIPEKRVIDWVDTREMISAICYQPDGKCYYLISSTTEQGFVVGSIKGNCRFYDHSAKTSHFDLQLHLFGKKKSCSKRITGFQFCPNDSKRIMITSADSTIRICNRRDAILKFKASRKAKRQLSASFTSDGRHIISMGEDSTVFIWNYDKQSKLPNKCAKSVRSFEFFVSEGASIAVPWPGMSCTLMNDGDQISTQPRRILEPVTWQRSPDCFSLSSRLFPDSSSRVSATWPEEKLSWQTKPQLVPGDSYERYHVLNRDYCSLTPPIEGTWGSVIVTAGIDGAIKSFHNYGLPIRL